MILQKTFKNKQGRVGITLVLSGILALAAICFILYTWSNMPESGIEAPETGTPLLYVGVFIVIIFALVMLVKAAK